MKISMTSYNRTTTIENDSDDLTMDIVIKDFIVPILFSMGYTEGTIREELNLNE